MSTFMNDDFLLSNDVAKKLYSDFAKNQPIIDYHCHIDAKEIAENKHFKNITELWLGGDHYKWRFMRASGVEEKYITGDATDKEKFIKWIEVLSSAIGNPLYHWSHLELKKYFGFEGYVKKENAEELWDLCNKVIASEDFRARKIIEDSNVSVLCTTDDPVDSLKYHDALAKDESVKFKVLPAFRPDNALSIEKPGFVDYINKLSEVSEIKINSLETLEEALYSRIKYFKEKGCVISDHGLFDIPFAPAKDFEANTILKKRLNGIMPAKEEIEIFQTTLLVFLHAKYKEAGFVSQLHYGCKRDNNEKMFKEIGPNTGFDCISSVTSGNKLADLLNLLNNNDALDKMIVYSLNPNDNEIIDTVIACFQDGTCENKIQHGSAWWFNDHKTGMENHLNSLSNNTNLAGFVGMLTDSRSFVSYTRHDYFRRILCNFLGTLVEKGEFPEDLEILGEIVEKISYKNAKEYFGF